MDNKRVGFAESIYSDLSDHQSTTHSNQILLNMSSYEKLDYFIEAAGFDHGPELLIATLLVVSILFGAIIAHCLLDKTSSDSETKQARKVLATILNEGNVVDKLTTTEDDMFDVPLNDSHSYQGPGLNDNEDMLTSQTCYAKAPSRPSKKTKKSNNVRVGNLVEDEDYSFDVEL